MDKSIHYLNNKIWYRGIKVFYIFCIAVVLLIAISAIYDNNFPPLQVIDNSKTIITCNYGNNGKFVASDNNIYFDKSEFGSGNYLTNNHRVEIQKLCGITTAEMDKKLGNIMDGTDNGVSLFNVSHVTKPVGGVIPFIEGSVISIVIILVIAEFIKRIFYYIALGTINPKK